METRGKKFPVTGDAKYIFDRAVAAGMQTSDKPVANSVACWNGGTYGHVAFVERYDGSEVYYSQANWDPSDTLSNGQIQIAPAGTDGKPEHKSRAAFEGMLAGFQGYVY